MQPLSALGRIQTGSTPLTAEEKYWGGDYPFVTPAELDKNFLIIDTPRTLSDEGVNQSRLLKEGAVMVCCIGSLGKIGIAGRPLVTNQQINSIEFDETQVLPKYGFYACQTLKPKLLSMAPATTIPIVSKSKFGQLEIPVPPLSEQRRIVAILEQADILRAKRQEALARLDELKQAIFIEMFGDPATNPKGWPTTTIGALLDSASYGTSEKSGSSGEFPVLRMNNITRKGEVDLADLKYMDLTTSEHERYLVKAGDVLFNRTNSAELVGKTAMFREQTPMAYAGYLIRLRTNANSDPEYLNGFMNTPYTKRVLRGMCKSIIGMANINATEVQSITIAKPPLELQVQYRQRIGALLQVKGRHREFLTALDDLFSSLQRRAFRGEL